MAVCRVCGQDKEPCRPKTRICRECNAAYMREWNAKNRDKACATKRAHYRKKRTDSLWVERQRKRGRESWHSLRREVMLAYGGFICQCCGETEEKFLSIDHINNDGASHRRSVSKNSIGNGKGASGSILMWLKKNGFPPGYQVLCMNCNMGKSRNGGICPHKSVSLTNTA